MKRVLLIAAIAVAGGAVAQELGDKAIRECYYKSYAYEKTQNYNDAIKTMQLVHAAHPHGYTPNLRLGWLYYLKGNYANAKRHYQEAIKIAPASVEAKLGYMLPLLAQRRYEEVEKIARQVIEIDYGNYYANLRLAVALREQGKLDQAVKVARRMLLLYPTDVRFLTELALIKAAQDEPNEAKRLFSSVLILDPENVTAKQELAKL